MFIYTADPPTFLLLFSFFSDEHLQHFSWKCICERSWGLSDVVMFSYFPVCGTLTRDWLWELRCSCWEKWSRPGSALGDRGEGSPNTPGCSFSRFTLIRNRKKRWVLNLIVLMVTWWSWDKHKNLGSYSRRWPDNAQAPSGKFFLVLNRSVQTFISHWVLEFLFLVPEKIVEEWET